MLCLLPLSRKSFISLVVLPFAILQLCLLPHSAELLSLPICEPALLADLISLYYIMTARDFYIYMCLCSNMTKEAWITSVHLRMWDELFLYGSPVP